MLPPALATVVRTGKFCKLFGPESASPGSLGVGPSPWKSSARSIPTPPLAKMVLDRMALPVLKGNPGKPGIITPSRPLKAMTLPAPAAVPPIVLPSTPETAERSTPWPVFPSGPPAALTPMKLPWIRFGPGLWSRLIPLAPLPEMILRAPGAVPPIVLPDALLMSTPPALLLEGEMPGLFGTADIPLASVPMKLPCTRL